MNPPSEVTVLSEKFPRPSLLPLLLEALERLSSFARETIFGITREVGRAGGAGARAAAGADRSGEVALGAVDGSRLSGRVTDDRRRAEDPPNADGLWAMTLDTDTEVVAGVVTVGRLLAGARLGVRVGGGDGFSNSMSFRFGDEFDDSIRRLGVSTPVLAGSASK